jgi:hypothetical protein
MGDKPKPLSADELREMESKNGVTGLSTVDVRRLLANNIRLRQLVQDAAQLLSSHPTPASNEARQAYEEIKAEVKRK